jgi:hypothetical protein
MILVISLLLLTYPVQAGKGTEVRFHDQRLTVHAHAVPLRDLVERIGDAADIKILHSERLDGFASVDVDTQPIDEVIKLLLRGFNYILTRSNATPDQKPAHLLQVYSRVDNASPRRGPVVVPALQAFHADQLNAQEQIRILNNSEDDADAESEDARSALNEREAAGEFDGGVSFDSLVDYLEDENPFVRERALIELSRRDPGRAFAYIVRAVRDDDLRVSEQAVEILSHHADAASLTQLGNILVKLDADLASRVGVFRAIAHRADPASTAFVKQVLDDQHPVIRDAAKQFLEEISRRMRFSADDSR